MVICKFYKEGRCKFGDNCRYEHIDEPRGSSGGTAFGAATNAASGAYNQPTFNNRPPPSSDPFSTTHQPPRRQQQHHQRPAQDSRPIWPLSAVANQDTSTGNLVGEEFSPEEMRVEAYRAAPRGRSDQITAREAALLTEHRQREAAARTASGTSASFVGHPFDSAADVPQEIEMKEDSSSSSHAPLDPFAGDPFTGGAFAQQQSQQQQQGAFGAFAPTQQRQQQPNAFAQSHNAFAQQQQPQNHSGVPLAMPSQSAPSVEPRLTAHETTQFSAASFGFENVPETAPPPRFC